MLISGSLGEPSTFSCELKRFNSSVSSKLNHYNMDPLLDGRVKIKTNIVPGSQHKNKCAKQKKTRGTKKAIYHC